MAIISNPHISPPEAIPQVKELTRADDWQVLLFSQSLQCTVRVNLDDLGINPTDAHNQVCIEQKEHGFDLECQPLVPVFIDTVDGKVKNATTSNPAKYLITEIPDEDTICIRNSGFVNLGQHNLTVGSNYYLSDSGVGGGIDDSATDNQLLLNVVDSNTISICIGG